MSLVRYVLNGGAGFFGNISEPGIGSPQSVKQIPEHPILTRTSSELIFGSSTSRRGVLPKGGL
jgi:hypothetical protein